MKRLIRPAAGSTAARHRRDAFRDGRISQRHLPGPYSRREGPEDVQEQRQRHRPLGRAGAKRRRRLSLVYVYIRPTGDSRRFSLNAVNDVIKKFWSTLWNTYSFFVTYANIDGWTPATRAPDVGERDPLDQWLLAELNQLVKDVTAAFEDYDAVNATRPIEDFVERLSNWYVRLSRDRFWKSEIDDSKMAAYATLYDTLTTLAKLLAPTMPFLSESMYRNLVADRDESQADSVHLARWPEANLALIDAELISEMALVRRLVSLGLSARNAAQTGVRQPLAGAQFALRDVSESAIVARYANLIKSGAEPQVGQRNGRGRSQRV